MVLAISSEPVNVQMVSRGRVPWSDNVMTHVLQ